MSLHKISYYQEPDSHGRNKTKAESHLPTYVTKADLKGATDVDISNLQRKLDLVILKAEVDKIDINKLKTVPADLSKLSNVVDVVKKTVYDELITKVNAVDPSRLIKKAEYDTKRKEMDYCYWI